MKHTAIGTDHSPVELSDSSRLAGRSGRLAAVSDPSDSAPLNFDRSIQVTAVWRPLSGQCGQSDHIANREPRLICYCFWCTAKSRRGVRWSSGSRTHRRATDQRDGDRRHYDSGIRDAIMPGSAKTWRKAFGQGINDQCNVLAGGRVPFGGLSEQPQVRCP
jgi:hypothetical protein